jgi:hypothetical protein
VVRVRAGRNVINRLSPRAMERIAVEDGMGHPRNPMPQGREPPRLRTTA